MKGIRALGLTFLALFGCSDSDPIRPIGPTASTVIANLAFGTANVDVAVSGLASPVATDLDFAEYTGACVDLPAGAPISVTFQSGATQLASRIVTLADESRYTMLLTDDASGVDLVLMDDDVPLPDADSRAVRVVNATDDPVDVYLFPEGEAMGTPLLADLPYAGDLTGTPQYVTRPANQTVVRFFPAGVSTGSPLAELELPLRDQAPVMTVVLSESATGDQVYALGPCL